MLKSVMWSERGLLKPSLRNLLLVLLTTVSGCVDAISFLSFGQVFTAAMTGNTVLFGLALSHSSSLSVLHYGMALVGFMIGALIAAFIFLRHRSVTGWSGLVTRTLCVELAALAIYVVFVYVLPGKTFYHYESIWILLLACGMGVQGVSARRIGMNGVTTTVITSTLTGLMESVAWNLGHRVQRGRDVSNPSVQPPKSEQATPYESIVMWITVIVFYGIGAGVCGLFIVHDSLRAVWLPIGLILVVLIVAITAQFRQSHTSTRVVNTGLDT